MRGLGYTAIRATGGNGTLDLRDITVTLNGTDYAVTNLVLPQWSFYNTKGYSVTNIIATNSE